MFCLIIAFVSPGMLGEHKIRDLNDEINKLMREKGHWEKQITHLGGPNYAVCSNDSVVWVVCVCLCTPLRASQLRGVCVFCQHGGRTCVDL